MYKNYIRVTAYQVVWTVISSTSALPAALWSTLFRYKLLIRVEQELQENPNQPNQRRWQLGHKESKPKMTGVAAWPGPGALALGVQRGSSPAAKWGHFPSSAKGPAPPDLQWNPLSLIGKSLFVLQCCHHLHWTLQPEWQHWEWPPSVGYFCSTSAPNNHGVCTEEH